MLASYLLAIGLLGQPEEPPASITPAESDQILLWSCSAQELAKLREQVITASGSRAPDQAWQVVHAYLCGREASSLEQLRRHLPEKVITIHEQRYSPDLPEQVPSFEFLPPKAWAWGAHATSQGTDISVSFSRDEVCTSLAQLRYRGAWLLVSEYNACD